MKWECLIEEQDCKVHEFTCRLKVFGGWIVKYQDYEADYTPSMVFVPDPHHLWNIEDKKKED